MLFNSHCARLWVISSLLFTLPAIADTGRQTLNVAPELVSDAPNDSRIVVAKSQVDKRQYHYEVLDNQLRVLLISDPQADKATAALDVGIGSASDPTDRPGLAHFLEHMLFLGTKKYPSADDYQAFISAQGGSHNAYTSAEHTNYFFEVDANQLAPTLDRFAQFFIAPLFDAAYVDRERHAVHSEYQAKIKDDYRRGYDVYRELLNPKHRLSKFSVGSLTTLADRPNDNVRDDLIAFYRQHYSADNMTLVVLGKESIAQLQQLVKPLFEQVAIRQPQVEPPATALFADNALPIEALIQPEALVRRMVMVFPLPSVEAYYREKPLQYIGHLLGHEGEGSLLSLLKRKGWSEGLSAGGGNNGSDQATFHISINLTEAGATHREDIRALVFYSLQQIQAHGVEQWRFQEEKRIADIAFQFREGGSGARSISALANNLHYYRPKDVIRGDYAYDHYDESLIKGLLAKLNPTNVLVMTSLPGVETNKESYYYRAPYRVNKIASEAPLTAETKSLVKQLHLPATNIFIPSSIALLDSTDGVGSSEQPVRLRNQPHQQIWFQQDTDFAVPRANIYLRLKSPLAATSPKYAAMNHLLVAIIKDTLNEQSYPASLAGLGFSLDANSRGVDINFQGYNDRMGALIELVFEAVRSPTLSKKRFRSLRQELLRHWRNSRKQTPYRQLLSEIPAVLFEPYWNQQTMADELENVSLRQLKRYAKRWRKGLQSEGLFYGNLKHDAVELWLSDIDSLRIESDDELPPARVLKLDNKKTIPVSSISVNHNDNAVSLYVQGLNDSLDDKAAMLLLRQIMESAFYSDLRTEQQLGYIVFLTGMGLKQVPGSLFVVQSPGTDVAAIQQAIRQFIEHFEDKLPEQLGVYQQAVVTQLLEKPKSLASMSARYWNSVLRHDTAFDYQNRLAEAVKSITPQQLRDYYQAVMKDTTKSYWLVSNKNNKDASTPLNDESQGYYSYQ